MNNEVVVTGRGLVTPIGVGLKENEEALLKGKSGITFIPEFKELGIVSQVAGFVKGEVNCPLLDRKTRRHMTNHTIYGTVAAYEALLEAKLDIKTIREKRVAIVLGHGGTNQSTTYQGATSVLENHNTKRVSPFIVPKGMPSSAVANLAIILGVTGESYIVSSACASGCHSIMMATRLLRAGMYDIVITGGTEELNWIHAAGFDAMHATSRSYNDTPTKASRPFDKKRDGFVIAEGAGILILETAYHAKSRGAKVISKISGVAANTNIKDMVMPDSQYSAAVMLDAIKDAGLSPKDISYVNTHGTSTPVGDPIEIKALQTIFETENKNVLINSTKSMTGHMIGATGSVETIFCTQMIEKNFVCPTINLDEPEDEFAWANIVKTTQKTKVKHALNNSLGFGGTNACLIISAPDA